MINLAQMLLRNVALVGLGWIRSQGLVYGLGSGLKLMPVATSTIVLVFYYEYFIYQKSILLIFPITPNNCKITRQWLNPV